MKRICVFCGSSFGGDQAFRSSAASLGRTMAGEGIELVYGGGKIGLMGEIARAVVEEGGRVTGVIPESLRGKELAYERCNELHVVTTMHERKALMMELSDAFIAMAGGFGTLEELFEVLTWLQLGIHTKPLGFLNTAGYYDGLLEFLGHAVGSSFILPEHLSMIPVDVEPAGLIRKLEQFSVPVVDKVKWIRDNETQSS